MATTIRLTRMGRKQAPAYRVVVVDSRDRRDGAYIDNLGVYNPIPAEYQCEIDSDRAISWLDKGATMSDTARSLLRNEGILYRWHLRKQGTDAAAIDTAVEEYRARRDKEREARAAARADETAAKMKAEQDEAKKARDAAEAEAKAAEAPAEEEAEEAATEEASEEAASAEAAEEVEAASDSAEKAPAEEPAADEAADAPDEAGEETKDA